MYKGGRPHNSAWGHFLIVTVNKKTFANCKRCNHWEASDAPIIQMHYTSIQKVLSQILTQLCYEERNTQDPDVVLDYC